MNRFLSPFIAVCIPLVASCSAPKIASVGTAMQHSVASGQIAGATTVVTTKSKILHLDSTGFADIARQDLMRPDTLFWIASMTKPVTATALLMLQDEGKLNVNDAVAKYIPDFASLKTPSGQPANLTIAQLMTHTSGLGEAERADADQAHTLADLVALFLKAPMQFEPGAQWRYCQSGINTAARIVEIASGKPFDAFLQERIFDPLGMKNTTFYPGRKPSLTLVTSYKMNKATAKLEPLPPGGMIGKEGHPPVGNGGLFSTGPDYARFCQMLLGGGVFEGKRLSARNHFACSAHHRPALCPPVSSNHRNGGTTAPTTDGESAPASCVRLIRASRPCSPRVPLATAGPGERRPGSTLCAVSLTCS